MSEIKRWMDEFWMDGYVLFHKTRVNVQQLRCLQRCLFLAVLFSVGLRLRVLLSFVTACAHVVTAS